MVVIMVWFRSGLGVDGGAGIAALQQVDNAVQQADLRGRFGRRLANIVVVLDCLAHCDDGFGEIHDGVAGRDVRICVEGIDLEAEAGLPNASRAVVLQRLN